MVRVVKNKSRALKGPSQKLILSLDRAWALDNVPFLLGVSDPRIDSLFRWRNISR